MEYPADEFPIDFVLTYVDDNDLAWQDKRQKYLDPQSRFFPKNYRSWDNLHYWFRCAAKFAPWVHKIFLVTDHQIPDWLNTENEKIVIINHDDYIPEKYLPVFSANPIETNFHRIKDLSEHFVFFNDDTFITSQTSRDFYFSSDGLPCDYPVEAPYGARELTFSHILSNDISLINSQFSRREVLKKHHAKFFSKAYMAGRKKNLYLSLSRNDHFLGFENLHLPSCMLKSAYEEVWDAFPEALDATCHNRFRNDNDINQYIFQYWMYVHGKFSPINWRKHTRSFQLNDTGTKKNNIYQACDAIIKGKLKLVCLNDAVIENFEQTKVIINSVFKSIVPDLCEFEKGYVPEQNMDQNVSNDEH